MDFARMLHPNRQDILENQHMIINDHFNLLPNLMNGLNHRNNIAHVSVEEM